MPNLSSRFKVALFSIVPTLDKDHLQYSFGLMPVALTFRWLSYWLCLQSSIYICLFIFIPTAMYHSDFITTQWHGFSNLSLSSVSPPVYSLCLRTHDLVKYGFVYVVSWKPSMTLYTAYRVESKFHILIQSPHFCVFHLYLTISPNFSQPSLYYDLSQFADLISQLTFTHSQASTLSTTFILKPWPLFHIGSFKSLYSSSSFNYI